MATTEISARSARSSLQQSVEDGGVLQQLGIARRDRDSPCVPLPVPDRSSTTSNRIGPSDALVVQSLCVETRDCLWDAGRSLDHSVWSHGCAVRVSRS